jgi:hypothetical protein
MLKLSTFFLLLLLFSLSLSLSQEAMLEMKFAGYGKNFQEIYISFKNIGQITLSDITIYVDGNVYKTITGTSAPGSTFEDVLFLEEGKHLVEARTPEGAYARLEVTASKGETRTTTTLKEKPEGFPFGLDITFVAMLVVLTIVVIAWFMIKKLGKK